MRVMIITIQDSETSLLEVICPVIPGFRKHGFMILLLVLLEASSCLRRIMYEGVSFLRTDSAFH